jgi:hypothetical protein
VELLKCNAGLGGVSVPQEGDTEFDCVVLD